ncbi:MAG: GTPase RsgA [Candidatus Handelsmanbacteria bacterium]|nr:GTPase RsgA [Candidatus Handelsmanbacteria bacterium]
MVEQEAAVVALGGAVQVYEHPAGLRNGQLAPWRCRRLQQVGQFVRQRRALCQGIQTVPQVAVLHSEHHARSRPGRNLMWAIDHSPVQGAVLSLLEAHYNVDILDEWALSTRLEEFPVMVAPEQDRMSAAMVDNLKEYVQQGGKLLLSGAAGLERFGASFLGVKAGECQENQTYHVPAAEGSLPVYGEAGELMAEVPGKWRHQARSPAEFPAVGDWVGVTPREEDKATIQALLPWRSKFTRLAAGQRTDEQVIAANIDTLFLVNGLDGDFNLRRLERYLLLAWDSGASPVIVLNKADRCPEVEARLAEVEEIACGVPVHPVSALEGEGLEALSPYLGAGQTVAVVGRRGWASPP